MYWEFVASGNFGENDARKVCFKNIHWILFSIFKGLSNEKYRDCDLGKINPREKFPIYSKKKFLLVWLAVRNTREEKIEGSKPAVDQRWAGVKIFYEVKYFFGRLNAEQISLVLDLLSIDTHICAVQQVKVFSLDVVLLLYSWPCIEWSCTTASKFTDNQTNNERSVSTNIWYKARLLFRS